MIPTILHSGRARTMETAKRSVVSRALEKGMKTWGTGDFRVVNLLYKTIMVDTGHHAFIKTCRNVHTTQILNPNVNWDLANNNASVLIPQF